MKSFLIGGVTPQASKQNLKKQSRVRRTVQGLFQKLAAESGETVCFGPLKRLQLLYAAGGPSSLAVGTDCVDEALLGAQRELAAWRKERAIMDLHQRRGPGGRPPKARAQLEKAMEGARAACKSWLSCLQGHASTVDMSSPAEVLALSLARIQAASGIGELKVSLKSLASNLRIGNGQLARHARAQSLRERRFHAVMRSDPNTIAKSTRACLNSMHERVASGEVLQPLGVAAMGEVAAVLDLFGVCSARELCEQVGIDWGTDCEDIVQQIVSCLPVVAVSISSARRSQQDTTFLLPVRHAAFAQAIASLMLMVKEGWKPGDEFARVDDTDMQVDAPGEEEEDGEDSEASDEEWAAAREVPGRKTLDVSRGEDFVKLVEGFVHSRGQIKLSDKGRLRPDREVFGASLDDIVDFLEKTHGIKVSRSGVYNLFMPARSNSQSTLQRGTIRAKVRTIRRTERAWHPACRYASTQLKYCMEFLTNGARNGCFRAATVHGDSMAAVPVWVPARGVNARQRFMLIGEGDGSEVKIADHTFSLAPRMLLRLSGWVFTADPPQKTKADATRPRKPDQVVATARAARYHCDGAKEHIDDFLYATSAHLLRNPADCLLVVTDNASDYTGPVWELVLGRVWRQQKLAWLGFGQHAPGYSAFNWQVESQWPKPNRELQGRQLGRSVAATKDALFASHADPESALREVTTVAMKEFVELLQGLSTNGKPWEVRAASDNEPRCITDFEDLEDYVSSGPRAIGKEVHRDRRREALDIGMHISRTPGCLQLRMCVENPCDVCKSIEGAQREKDPSWSAAAILRPLLWNNGFVPAPVRQEAPPAADCVCVSPASGGELAAAPAEGDDISAEHLRPRVHSWRINSDDAGIRASKAVFCPYGRVRAHLGGPQSDIFLPIGVDKVRNADLSVCPHRRCRYVSTNKTMAARHRLTMHGAAIAHPGPHLGIHAVPAGAVAYDLGDAPPLPEPKKRARDDGGDAMFDADAEGAGPAAPKVAKRSPAAQCPPDEIKKLFPKGCTPSHIGVQVDRVTNMRYVVQYEHHKMDGVDDVPLPLIGQRLAKVMRTPKPTHPHTLGLGGTPSGWGGHPGAWGTPWSWGGV